MAVKNVRYKTIPMALPTITFGMSHVEGQIGPILYVMPVVYHLKVHLVNTLPVAFNVYSRNI